MKAFRHGLILSILAFFTSNAACGMEKVSLQLKWLHQFQFAGYYAAIEQGYYAAEGLEVQLLEASQDRKPTDVVLAGEADFGVSSADLLLIQASETPIQALAAIYQHSPNAFAAIQGNEIQSIHDLAGKRIMLEPGSADLIAMLKAEQIDLESIQFIDHTFSPLPLHHGEVDAISTYITDEPFAIRALGQQPLIFSPRSAGIDFYSDILFTTEEFSKSNPDTVAAFRRASLKGWDYALKNPYSIIELILEKYPTIKSREALEYEALRSIDLIRPEIIEIGYMHIGRWKHIAETFQSVGMIDEIPDLEAMLYRDALPLSERYPLKLIGIGLLSILSLGLIAWKEWHGRRRLEAEIKRRKVSDELLSERENEYQNMFEGAPLAFIVWDINRTITHWNQEAELLFGWSAKEVVGRQKIDLIVPTSAMPILQEGINTLRQDGVRTQVNENVTKSGRRITCRWHNVPRKNREGAITEFHSIAADITREVKRELRLKHDRENALSASESKDFLIAQTSHEIRNPLNGIMGFAQMILSDTQDEEVREMSQTILDGAQGMLEILNDLLDSAKIESGQMDVTWAKVDLAGVLRNEAKLFSQLIREQGLDCDIHIDEQVAPIISDQRCIRQILSNLINNARKFTQSGSIEMRLSQVDTDQVSIQIKDTGIGMNAETLKRVFEPFVQGSTTTQRDFGGTGLGLSLTMKLAELIGGTLTAESELGQGSTFTLTLPQKPKE